MEKRKSLDARKPTRIILKLQTYPIANLSAVNSTYTVTGTSFPDSEYTPLTFIEYIYELPPNITQKKIVKITKTDFS